MAVPTCLLETEEDATPYPESLNQSRRRAWKAACVFQALQPRHKGNSLSTIVKTVDVDLERKNYWEDSGEGFSAPTQQDSRSAGTASPGGMSSSLENAASTTAEGESSPTDTAGVAGDGVFSPPLEPDEAIRHAQKRTTTPTNPKTQHGVMLNIAGWDSANCNSAR